MKIFKYQIIAVVLVLFGCGFSFASGVIEDWESYAPCTSPVSPWIPTVGGVVVTGENKIEVVSGLSYSSGTRSLLIDDGQPSTSYNPYVECNFNPVYDHEVIVDFDFRFSGDEANGGVFTPAFAVFGDDPIYTSKKIIQVMVVADSGSSTGYALRVSTDNGGDGSNLMELDVNTWYHFKFTLPSRSSGQMEFSWSVTGEDSSSGSFTHTLYNPYSPDYRLLKFYSNYTTANPAQTKVWLDNVVVTAADTLVSENWESSPIGFVPNDAIWQSYIAGATANKIYVQNNIFTGLGSNAVELQDNCTIGGNPELLRAFSTNTNLPLEVEFDWRFGPDLSTGYFYAPAVTIWGSAVAGGKQVGILMVGRLSSTGYAYTLRLYKQVTPSYVIDDIMNVDPDTWYHIKWVLPALGTSDKSAILQITPQGGATTTYNYTVTTSELSYSAVKFYSNWTNVAGRTTVWYDNIGIDEQFSPPANCEDVKNYGYGMEKDLDGDCRIGFGDVDLLCEQWLSCTDPMNPACEDTGTPDDKKVITQASSPIVVDGDLSDWPTTAKWEKLNVKLSGGTVSDINCNETCFASYWDPAADLVYVAAKVTDSAHIFSKIGELDFTLDCDYLEICSQGDNTGGNFNDITYEDAQHYRFGYHSTGSWTSWGCSDELLDTSAVTAYAVAESGNVISYEIAFKMFDNYGDKGGVNPTIVTDLNVGKKVKFDVLIGSQNSSNHIEFGTHTMANWGYTTYGWNEYEIDVPYSACGEWGYLTGDWNEDCRVNFKDFAEFALEWLDCVVPGDSNCDTPWLE